MSSRRPADGPPAGQPPAKKPALDLATIRAQIAAKKAEVEARIAGSAPGSGAASPAPAPGSRDSGSDSNSPAPPSASTSKIDPNIQARMAAARARIDALNKKRAAGPEAPAAAPEPPKPKSTGVALHPLLMADNVGVTQEKNEKRAMRDRYKTMAPKFSSVRANAAAAEEAAARAAKAAPTVPVSVSNPYAPSASGVGIGPEEAEAPGPVRKSRKMAFSAPGKYVKQGDQLRNDLKLEELKQRIAAQSRKAGLDSEFDVLERSLKRQPPPAVEWWDEAILPPGGSYAELDKAAEFIETSTDSLVTHLVQHPIPITAAGDRRQPERGLMLTKKEQKKMRRQRRMAELKDKQDRVRMGLIPPDPPKVRLANMMKVLTSDAVQDPTKLEKRIVREVQLRALKHEKDNQDRKLSKEERAAKEYAKLVSLETKRGLQASVYLIRYLTNGRHRFKVRKTAEHDLLSGMCIFHPSFALVVVEGVGKKIKHYRQLMMSRIDWTEEPRARDAASDSESGSDNDDDKDKKDGDGEDNGPDMSQNKCELIWEGDIPERAFRYFRARHAETDTEGKNFLTPRYEGLWDLAKRWNWDGDDL